MVSLLIIILKDAFTAIPFRLCEIFSVSLKSGKFPRNWAKGFINILLKSGDLRNPGNWRPITQTCVPAKLLEKVNVTFN